MKYLYAFVLSFLCISASAQGLRDQPFNRSMAFPDTVEVIVRHVYESGNRDASDSLYIPYDAANQNTDIEGDFVVGPYGEKHICSDGGDESSINLYSTEASLNSTAGADYVQVKAGPNSAWLSVVDAVSGGQSFLQCADFGGTKYFSVSVDDGIGSSSFIGMTPEQMIIGAPNFSSAEEGDVLTLGAFGNIIYRPLETSCCGLQDACSTNDSLYQTTTIHGNGNGFNVADVDSLNLRSSVWQQYIIDNTNITSTTLQDGIVTLETINPSSQVAQVYFTPGEMNVLSNHLGSTAGFFSITTDEPMAMIRTLEGSSETSFRCFKDSLQVQTPMAVAQSVPAGYVLTAQSSIGTAEWAPRAANSLQEVLTSGNQTDLDLITDASFIGRNGGTFMFWDDPVANNHTVISGGHQYQDAVVTVPNQNGYLTLSVNGTFADTSGNIDLTDVGYLEYTALISQDGDTLHDPTVIELTNTLGYSLDWDYVSPGHYECYDISVGMDKVFTIINQGGDHGESCTLKYTLGQLTMVHAIDYGMDNWVGEDGFNFVSVWIRVYP